MKPIVLTDRDPFSRSDELHPFIVGSIVQEKRLPSVFWPNANLHTVDVVVVDILHSQ